MLVNIKKIALSLSLIVLFTLYSLQRHAMLPGQSGDTALNLASSQSTTASTGQPKIRATSVATGSPPLVASSKQGTSKFGPTITASDPRSRNVSADPTQSPTPAGQYLDGTYVGPETDANWGYVQVQVVIVNGQIDTVDFLEFPNHRSRSRSINSRAIPELQQEVIQAQSAEVDTVSGATDTSEAFIRSLDSALSGASR